MYRGWKYSDIAEFLLVTNNTITNWINLYKVGGIESLLTLHYRGGQAQLSEEQLLELKSEANKGSFAIAKDVKHYIKQNFGIEYNLSHVQLMSKKNGSSLFRIRYRPNVESPIFMLTSFVMII